MSANEISDLTLAEQLTHLLSLLPTPDCLCLTRCPTCTLAETIRAALATSGPAPNSGSSPPPSP